MNEQQNINQLPKSWKKQKFAEVIEFLTDFQANGSFAGLKDNVQYYSEKNYAVLVRLKDLRHSLKDEDSFVYTDEKGYNFLKKSRVVEGDVLVANVGAGVGTTLKMPKFIGKATLGPNMFRVDLKESISSNFFFAFSNSLNYWQQLKLVSAGSGQPKINKSQYRSIEIPVPPLETQQAIVSKIEELFSELDKGIENLRTAQQQLKTYRQSVLKWAFEGKLTNENLKEEELPKKWKWVSIEFLLSDKKKGMGTGPFGTMLKKSEHQKSGVPVLGIENIGEGVFQMPNKIFVTNEKAIELKSFRVKENDIIISRSGTVGEICLLPKKMENSIISTNLIRVSLNLEIINPKYFVYLFQGGKVRQQVFDLCKGSSRAFLNQTILNSLDFPYCSIEEQNKIIQEIESRLSVADKMEESITQSLQQAEALRQSILKKAFKGKLI